MQDLYCPICSSQEVKSYSGCNDLLYYINYISSRSQVAAGKPGGGPIKPGSVCLGSTTRFPWGTAPTPLATPVLEHTGCGSAGCLTSSMYSLLVTNNSTFAGSVVGGACARGTGALGGSDHSCFGAQSHCALPNHA